MIYPGKQIDISWRNYFMEVRWWFKDDDDLSASGLEKTLKKGAKRFVKTPHHTVDGFTLKGNLFDQDIWNGIEKARQDKANRFRFLKEIFLATWCIKNHRETLAHIRPNQTNYQQKRKEISLEWKSVERRLSKWNDQFWS